MKPDVEIYNTQVEIVSALDCPACGDCCISIYPKDFMLTKFYEGIRSLIFCRSCEWEISGEQLEKELFRR